MEGGSGGAEMGVWAIITSSIAGFMSWAVKAALNRHIARVDEMDKALDEHRLYAAENYVKRSDMKQAIDEAISPLADGQRRMEDKLDMLISREINKNHTS